jgi:hypothetical protein
VELTTQQTADLTLTCKALRETFATHRKIVFDLFTKFAAMDSEAMTDEVANAAEWKVLEDAAAASEAAITSKRDEMVAVLLPAQQVQVVKVIYARGRQDCDAMHDSIRTLGLAPESVQLKAVPSVFEPPPHTGLKMHAWYLGKQLEELGASEAQSKAILARLGSFSAEASSCDEAVAAELESLGDDRTDEVKLQALNKLLSTFYKNRVEMLRSVYGELQPSQKLKAAKITIEGEYFDLQQ